MREVTLSELQENIAELITNVSNEEERFVIVDDSGNVVAGLVSPDDVVTLDELDGLMSDASRHEEIRSILEGILDTEK
jgi:PHD/YefM family antitoxin component YafN of YafNO toxin-antitoxin module